MNSSNINNTTMFTGMMGGLAIGAIIILVVYAIMVISYKKIFDKAGYSDSLIRAIIPFYNVYTMFSTVNCSILFFVYIISCFIPVIGGIIAIVAFGYTMYMLAKAFGKGVVFTLGLVLLNPIFMLMLAFDSSQFCQVKGFTLKK